MERKTCLIAIDQGSSGTMSALFDQNLRQIDCVDISVGVSTPRYGWVEQDPWELLNSVRDGVKELARRHPGCMPKLGGIGLANQGESFLLWDTVTGEPVTPVISWQDTRSEDYCTRLKKEGREKWFHERTGLHLSAEWPALKIREMRRMDRELDEKCKEGKIAFGQLDAWFLYVLSGRKKMASDHSTACRTGFYHLQKRGWDPELISFFHGDSLIFPELVDSICQIDGLDLGIGSKLSWICGGLDQAVTLIGQGCVRPGEAKVTYGTCCACWMNLGQEPVLDQNLTTSVAWQTDGKPTYALAAEGGASGNIITWLLRNFCPDWKLEDLSKLAKDHDEGAALVFVPAFQGLSAPYWKEAKGTIFGVTAGTKPEHILAAGLKAVACTVRDILDCMPQAKRLVLDGGMTANDYLVQKQADILGYPVERSKEKEGTLMGIALLGAKSLGWKKDLQWNKAGDLIEPDTESDEEYQQWKKAVETVISYYE